MQTCRSCVKLARISDLIHTTIPIASPERPMAGMRAGYNMAKKSSHGVAPKVSVVECP